MHKIDNFIEYLIPLIEEAIIEKKGLFVNRFGGTDLKAMADHFHNPDYDIEGSIKGIEEYNGYYDLTSNSVEKKEKFIKFLCEIDRIYKDNKTASAIGVSYLILSKMLNGDKFITNYFKADEFVDHKYFSYNHAFENIKNFYQLFNGIASKKKILIVSSFTESIKHQIAKNNFLNHFNGLIMPDCEFIFLQTYITYRDEINGQFETPHTNFFETVDYYNNILDNLDFDIALLGCGSYAHFLGEHIKSINKVSIYVGAMLQMYFGVLGDRWIIRATTVDKKLEKVMSKFGDRLINNALVNDLNLENCIQPLEHFDYTKNKRKESLNHYMCSFDDNLFKIPEDFNWEKYAKIYTSIKLNEIEAKNHYLLHKKIY